MAQVTQSLRVNLKAYNWESLTANLLDEAKRLEVSGGYNSIQYIKNWKKKKAPAIYYKYYHFYSYNEDSCAFLYPEKAPKGWKSHSNPKAVTKVQKKPQKTPKHTRDKREERITAIIAASTSTSATSSDSGEDIQLKDIPQPTKPDSNSNSNIELIDVPLATSLDTALKVNNYNRNTPNSLNTITNNLLVLKLSLKEILN